MVGDTCPILLAGKVASTCGCQAAMEPLRKPFLESEYSGRKLGSREAAGPWVADRMR